MRISDHPDDDGYVADIDKYVVYLDGAKVEDEIQSADDAKGEVLVYALAPNGNRRRDANGPGGWAITRKTGAVRILKGV
jgi:hypothetical protein